MKKVIAVISALFLLVVSGCSCEKKENNKIEYTHYIRGGGNETLKADILWEYHADAYVKYQVSYVSYVCSDPSKNYINVMYIELTTKGNKEDSLIRNISFSSVEDDSNNFNVGLWGDFKIVSNKDVLTPIENELLPRLKYMKYDDVSSLSERGYGNYKNIDDSLIDSISGATVSASNIISVVKAIFDYHIENNY